MVTRHIKLWDGGKAQPAVLVDSFHYRYANVDANVKPYPVKFFNSKMKCSLEREIDCFDL